MIQQLEIRNLSDLGEMRVAFKDGGEQVKFESTVDDAEYLAQMLLAHVKSHPKSTRRIRRS